MNFAKLSLITALALFGCDRDETAAAYGAADAVWVLQEIDGASFPARASLEFGKDGAVSGEAPCNIFSTNNSVPYPWFKAGPIAATKRACPDLKAEAQYLDALSRMTQIEVLGDVLILR